ncbi:MAG: cell division protein FtsH, partial [Desulfobacula sp.]|nr:cell division protein FtsH [Desulfobacula sp.]
MTQAKAYSEETARKIDAEVNLIVDRAYKAAKKVLKENIDILHALTDLLIEKETVLGPELDDLIASMRPDFDFFGKQNLNIPPVHPAEPEDQKKSVDDDKDGSEDAQKSSGNQDQSEADDQTLDDTKTSDPE